MNVYLNGLLALSGTFSVTYGSSQRIVAGVRPDNAAPTAGVFDELAIYNAVLSGDEIRWHYLFHRP